MSWVEDLGVGFGVEGVLEFLFDGFWYESVVRGYFRVLGLRLELLVLLKLFFGGFFVFLGWDFYFWVDDCFVIYGSSGTIFVRVFV